MISILHQGNPDRGVVKNSLDHLPLLPCFLSLWSHLSCLDSGCCEASHQGFDTDSVCARKCAHVRLRLCRRECGKRDRGEETKGRGEAKKEEGEQKVEPGKEN